MRDRILAATLRATLLLWVATAACSSQTSSERVPETKVRVSAPPLQTVPGPDVAGLTPADQDSLLLATFVAAADLGRTRAAVVARLGQPSSTARRLIANPHVVGQTDTLVSLSYERLKVSFWVSGAGTADEVLFDIELLTPWPLDVHVPPAASRARLVQLWGKPAFFRTLADTLVLNWNVWAYDAEEYLQAYLVDDAIRKLRWSFYID